jgi:tetratricopeptide (TPR) repeat protein
VRIASTTLTGSNADIIIDGLLSVTDQVDAHVIIDTGAKDNTIELVQEKFGSKAIIVNYTWINDFSHARNFALKKAHELGFDWVITLDTDERIIFNNDTVKEFMDSEYEVVGMKARGGHYGKERMFKLPVGDGYSGPTHEAFPGYKFKHSTFKNAVFWEVPKSLEALKHKFERDIVILKKHTAKNPTDPRWFYYLGESYKNTGQYEKSIQAYKKCHQLNGWAEESGWACFRIAECYVALKDFRSAADTVLEGLKRFPGAAELHWMAGWCEYYCGRYSNALFHAKYAIAGGMVEGFQKEVDRIGFKHPAALYEAPYDLASWSYKMMGNDVLAQEYKEKHKAALELRMAAY